MKSLKIVVGLVLFTGLAVGSYHLIGAQRASAQTQKKAASPSGFDAEVRNNSERMMKEGQQTFRFDTFGSEAFGVTRCNSTKRLQARRTAVSEAGWVRRLRYQSASRLIPTLCPIH
jgi:hypothetical protein